MIPKVKTKLELPPHKFKEGLLGVEVEVEGNNLPHLNNDWRTERDHSLRGESNEYVMREPRSLEDTHTCLQNLEKALKDNKATFNNSVRAGVHVHVNVQDLDIVEMYNMMTIYYIVEEILVNYCGCTREGNLFCLRATDAEYQIDVVEKAISSKSLKPMSDDTIRYSALNLCSLAKYGSLEFRAMRSTKDFNVLRTWCDMVAHLYDLCAEYESPQEVYEEAYNQPERFLERVFKSGVLDEEVLQSFSGDAVEALDSGLELVVQYATNTNWNSFEEVLIGGLSFPVGTEFPDEPVEDF